MIVKEIDPYVAGGGDTFTRAGRRAEEQMAFYLRRAFGEKKDRFVFNDLRLVRRVNGVEDVGQIDHLVMHRAGLVIIESKAVHDRVRVNERGEWSRTFGGQHRGMPSPIEQAKRQATFLIKFLDDHASEIAGKLLGLVQAHFGLLSVDVIVAVSDSGIIDRPRSLPLPEVCKADQVAAKVEELFAQQRRETGILASITSVAARRGRDLSRSEMENLITFLPVQHRPAKAASEKLPEPAIQIVASAQEPSLPPVAPAVINNGDDRPPAASDEACAVCGVALSPKVAQYCRDNEKRFQGRLLCFPHQRRSKPVTVTALSADT